jgi:GNAT superfamily N-acetyltransferase
MTYEKPSTLMPGTLRLPGSSFRRLGPADARRLRSHLLRLHPDDVHNRFMGGKQRSLIMRYVRSIDWRSAVIIGCFLGRSMRGICELYPIDARRGEIAVSVERRFQRRGIGREMLRRTLLLARNRGLVDLELRCFTSNGKMRALVRSFDGKLDIEAMEATAVIHALPPTPVTYLSEMLEQAGLVGSSLMRLWLRTPERTTDRCRATPDLFGHHR